MKNIKLKLANRIILDSDTKESEHIVVPFLKDGNESIHVLIPNTPDAKDLKDFSIEIKSNFIDINKEAILKLFKAINL